MAWQICARGPFLLLLAMSVASAVDGASCHNEVLQPTRSTRHNVRENGQHIYFLTEGDVKPHNTLGAMQHSSCCQGCGVFSHIYILGFTKP